MSSTYRQMMTHLPVSSNLLYTYLSAWHDEALRSLPIDVHDYLDDPFMPNLKDIAKPQGTGIFDLAYDDDDFYNSPFADQDVGADADFNNMEPSIVVSPIPTTRIHYIHLKAQIIRDPKSAVQTRRMAKQNEA
ncbi:hypothetical protein Tco_0089547 [Tanacetum coccineum]